MGRYISTTPGAVSTIREVSTTYQSLPNDRIMADCSGSAFTITLPPVADVIAGDVVQIVDVLNNAQTNNITVGRNSANINSAAEDMTIDVKGSVTTFTYVNVTYGWVITSV